MTTRHAGYIVTLKADVREDDAEDTITAIGMIKNVISVKPVVGDISEAIAFERAKLQLTEKLWEALHPKEK